MIETNINEVEVLDIELEEGTLIIGEKLPDYEGDYEITPETYKQIIATKDKSMKKDIVINEIPFVKTSNIFGTTVTIAR